jgi:hypothetical protein
MLRRILQISKEGKGRNVLASRGNSTSFPALLSLVEWKLSALLLYLEFPDCGEHFVKIEARAATSHPNHRNLFPAHERLHEAFADAKSPGDCREVGEGIAVVRQSGFGNDWHRLGNGRLGIVGGVELFGEFHDVLLLFSGG